MTTSNLPGDDDLGAPSYESPGSPGAHVGTASGAYGGSSPSGSSSSGSDMKDQAKQTAETAADESKRVAGVATDEAQNVAQEAKEQARGLLDDALSEVDQQSRTQRDNLVKTLRTFSDDLEQMASQSGRSGMATDVARQVADKTRGFSSRIEGRDPGELLDDVRDFARRKPGAFLLGALAAGVVAGRFVRGSKAAHDDATSTSGTPGYSGATSPSAMGYSSPPTPTPLETDPLDPGLTSDPTLASERPWAGGTTGNLP